MIVVGVFALGATACDKKAEEEDEAVAKGGGGGGASGGGAAGAGDAADEKEGGAGEQAAEAGDPAGLVFTVSGDQLPEKVTFRVPNELVTPYIGTNMIVYNGGKLMSAPVVAEGNAKVKLQSFTFEVKGHETGTYEDGKFDLSMSIDVGTDDDINLGEDPKGKVELNEVEDRSRTVVGKLDVDVGDSGHDHDGVRYEVTGTIDSAKPKK